ncbi:hypothetical protein [Streptomyces flavidovirens]
MPGTPDDPARGWHSHPTDEDDALRETAQDLFTDLMTQFGLDPQL